jgi:RNA polymerase sigma-70 factor (ECF subfamily)
MGEQTTVGRRHYEAAVMARWQKRSSRTAWRWSRQSVPRARLVHRPRDCTAARRRTLRTMPWRMAERSPHLTPREFPRHQPTHGRVRANPKMPCDHQSRSKDDGRARNRTPVADWRARPLIIGMPSQDRSETAARDRALLHRLRTDDHAALGELYADTAPGLLRAATAYLSADAAAAEDVVHDVFVRIWETRNTLTIRSTFAAYLFTSVRNRALDRTKHENVSARHDAAIAPTTIVDPVFDNDEPPPDVRVATLLASLTPQRQEVVRLRWLEGLSYTEIAEITGTSVAAVEKTLQRALAQMRLIAEPTN